MQRRTWTADEKLGILLAGLKQTLSVAELCREHQISQTQYYKWRDQFLEGGKQALMGASSGVIQRSAKRIRKRHKH